MKLIIAIVQDEDSTRLLNKLMENGFGATKLATTGGFLKAGNTTLMVGVDEDKLSTALRIIEGVCKSRKQMTSAPTTNAGITGGGYSTYPVEVTVGGATVFVLSVDQFVKM